MSYGVERRVDVRVPMRDGVTLSMDLFLPRGAGASPAILIRTPYSNNNQKLIEKGSRLASQGYVCAVQDVRGRWDSDGDYYPFLNEAEDGFDAQQWLGGQSWCDGSVGTAGASYLGTTQWRAAPLGSEFLKCMAPRVICTDYHSGLLYPGGALQLNVAMTWGMRTHARTGQDIDFHQWSEAFRHLPLVDMDVAAGRDLPFWRDWIAHPGYDAYWEALVCEDMSHSIRQLLVCEMRNHLQHHVQGGHAACTRGDPSFKSEQAIKQHSFSEKFLVGGQSLVVCNDVTTA